MPGIPVRNSHSSWLILPTSDASDHLRLAQLAGDTADLATYLLRSPSLLNRPETDGLRFLLPQFGVIVNSATPFSLNDGSLWAGRGPSFRITGGVAWRRGRLRLIVAPEVDRSFNGVMDFDRKNQYFSPIPGPDRFAHGNADPWYAVGPYSADVPRRMGKLPFWQLWYGQSGVWYDAGPVEFGATSENAWWGPGIRNALILSDNAAGIPRLELRSPHPLSTRLGTFEWRWFSGALTESHEFDTVSTNNVRSIAAAAVAWTPSFQPGLTLGLTRAVYGTARGYGGTPFHFLDVFRDTGHPGARPISDSTLTPGGYEQLISLFARWVFPADGFETYAEWGRQDLPASLHDLLAAPTYGHAYTLGVQWRRPVPVDRSALRIQAEVTTLEQSSSFRSRPMGVWYTSHRVIQGYTEMGQPIGASIGPGSSSQWFAIDRIGPRGSLGVFFNRIRWNEDVRSIYNWPAYQGYCNHDVSIIPGVRGARATGAGYLSGELSFGTRLNAYLQNASGCQGPAMVDLKNVSIAVHFTPFQK